MTPTPTPQQMTLATIEAARADIDADAWIIKSAVTGLPTSSVRTTVRVDIPGGVTLSGGELLTAVLVHRTVYPAAAANGMHSITRQVAEGLVGGDLYRLQVSLVDELITRAEQQ